MKAGGVGGANTKTGLVFEGETDLASFLSKQKDYSVKNNGKYQDVYYKSKLVGNIFQKHGLYRYLDERGVDWQNVLSKKLLPDDSIYVIINNTAYVVEKKFQKVAGSVDEKLQTCDFKKKQYIKLFSLLNIEVEYMYLLSDWFKKDEYKDVRDYIVTVGCHYYFEYIPLQKLGLPVPT
ncbi:hypothetical protein FWF93_00815 [Candidatus Saccharibacteria bacterium]|nr:hypothetical protein [Candidatus Saccharibacteria bacterium]